MAGPGDIAERLRAGRTSAADIRLRHVAPGRLQEEALGLVDKAWKAFGLQELLQAGDDGEKRRLLFGEYLTNNVTPGATPDVIDRVDRIGQVLLKETGQDAAKKLELLKSDGVGGDRLGAVDDIRFLTQHLSDFSQRMEIAGACIKNITPKEIDNLFAAVPALGLASNDHLEALFDAAGSTDANAKMKALSGAFEWAAVSNNTTFESLYAILNRFAQYKTAQKNFTTTISESYLQGLVEKSKGKIDLKELRNRANGTGSTLQRIRSVQKYLQDNGTGWWDAFLLGAKTSVVADIVTYLSTNQQEHLQHVASMVNVLLQAHPIMNSAVHSLLRKTTSIGASPITSHENEAPRRVFVDKAYSIKDGVMTLDEELQRAWADYQRDTLLLSAGAQSTNPAEQTAFLDHYYGERMQGGGFLRWLLDNVWGRKRQDIVSRGALNTIPSRNP